MVEIVSAGQRDVIRVLRERGAAPARDIANDIDSSKRAVLKWASKLCERGLANRNRGGGKYGADVFSLTNDGEDADILTEREAYLRKPCRFYVDSYGYVQARSDLDGEQDAVLMHRLLAVAYFGFDTVVASDVHHKNGIPWANWPGNLEVVGASAHISTHWHGKPLDERLAEADDRYVASALREAGYPDAAKTLHE